jgi:DNA-binding transcriptional LysR family regulator
MDAPVLAREPLPSRELAAFVAATEAGSIGAAAYSLALSQSAVTKRLQSLERQVGCSLLTRSHRGVQPTAAGEALYPEAKAVLVSLARAAETLDRRRASGERRLRLAASHTIGTFLLPRWLAAFVITGPATPRVSVVNSDAVLAAVHNREVDIGFLPDATRDDLDALEVGQDELVVVVGREHPWASADSVAPAQLTSQPFFTREEGSGTRAASLAGLRRLGVELHPELETSSTEALKLTVRRSGFTIMSSLAISDEIRQQQLHPLRLEGVRLHRRLFAVRCHDVPATGATRRFWAWLEASCRSAQAPAPLPEAVSSSESSTK